jgi:predicted DsbA family dithiol-disulfide isomerase
LAVSGAQAPDYLASAMERAVAKRREMTSADADA